MLLILCHFVHLSFVQHRVLFNDFDQLVKPVKGSANLYSQREGEGMMLYILSKFR